MSIEYLAGFVDGEGCISLGIKRQPRTLKNGEKVVYYSWTAHMTVSNTHKDILDKLCDEWEVGRVNISRTTHFLRERGLNVKEAWVWVIEPNDMRILLPKLAPFLVVKQKQAYLLIEALKLMEVRKGKTEDKKIRLREIYEENKKLNKKGRF